MVVRSMVIARYCTVLLCTVLYCTVRTLGRGTCNSRDVLICRAQQREEREGGLEGEEEAPVEHAPGLHPTDTSVLELGVGEGEVG